MIQPRTTSDQGAQHRFQRRAALHNARGVFKGQPAFVEAVEHLDPRHRVAHYAIYDYDGQNRAMRRTTVAGALVVGVDGRTAEILKRPEMKDAAE